MKIVSLLIAVHGISFACGFQRSTIPKATTTSSRRSTSRYALPPVEHLADVHSVLTQTPAWSLLADAAATLDPTGFDLGSGDGSSIIDQVENAIEAAASVEAEIAEDQGIWQAYLNLFKAALTLIHDTVDEPIRNTFNIEHTWGISIALFTASFRTLLLPLSLQQTKSAEYMKALKPYQDKIKKKYKDKDQQNKAIAKLFEDAEQNPLAGCLISLAQLPVLLGLYRGIRLLAVDGKLNEPFLWIPSLEGPVTAETDYRGLDWLTSGWVDNVPPMGWETTLAFLIMPCLLVLGQSLTMSVLTPPVDPNLPDEEREQAEKTQGALKFLPLLIGFFSLQVPAGLTIYWFTTNVFTLSSTLGARLYYKLNPPEIELPDYWDALDNTDELSSEEKRKAAKAGIQVGPTYEDMLEVSRFHNLVERKPLRSDMPKDLMAIPTELLAWVGPLEEPKLEEETEIESPSMNVTATVTA